MTPLQIRRLSPADAASYFSLRLHSLREAPAASWASVEEEADLPVTVIEERLAVHLVQCSFGAFADGQLLAIASLKHDTAAKIRHRANVWGVYVAPQARKRGAARQLLEAIEAHARQSGVLTQLTLVVNSGNAVAAALYAKCGFVVTGMDRRSTCIDGVYHDELRMVRFLDQADGD